MPQVTTGIRKILESSLVYSLYQNLIGTNRVRKMMVEEKLHLKKGASLLDVGCGPGDLMEYLPADIEYVGFDFNPDYIAKAKRKYGARGTFHCSDVNEFDFQGTTFDRIFLGGILHHIDDDKVDDLMYHLARRLNPGGLLFTIETVYDEGQSRMAKFIISKDRGQNVRDATGYVKLIRKHFTNVEFEIRHNLIRLPYSNILITCSN